MKAIKFFIAAMAMTFAMGVNAQILKDGHFTANFNVGSYAPSTAGFGLGVGYQTRELYSCDWVSLAWDVAHIEWDAPFNSPGDLDQLSFKTGGRAFSPSFANDHLRAYTNLAMGYVLGIVSENGTDTSHSFGLTYGLGLQLNQKWSLGYTLLFTKNKDGKGKSHFATLAYTF